MADESLVPTDQPYGERQKNKELMQMAGLPLGAAEPQRSVGGPAVSSSPPSGGGVPGLDLLTEADPMMPYDWVDPDPFAEFRRIATTSPNSFARALAQRILAYKGVE